MFTILFFLISIHSHPALSQPSIPALSKLCQSGLREDNTNYIYCSRQDLTEIPSFFSDLTPTNVFYDELVLSDNLIERIEQTSFGSMLKVRKLYLDQNPIRFIHDRAFEHVRNYLENLYFDQKTLPGLFTDLQEDTALFDTSVFHTCFNLNLLSIKNYNLVQLKDFQFLRMTRLKRLVLANNRITQISDQAFRGLEKSLVELNLDSNLIELVPTRAVQYLQRLNSLSLSQNRIKSLQADSFPGMASLQSLDLSYNLLSKLDRVAFSGPIRNSLRAVHLQNNELDWQSLVDLLRRVDSLEEVNMDFNKLARPARAEHFTMEGVERLELVRMVGLKLKSLSMQGNRLTEKDVRMLARAFENVEYVGGEAVGPGVLGRFGFSELVRLNLARNKIKRLPSGFFERANMTRLEW
jgi:Leucine-rich repeat (LRR) protein